MKKRLPIIIITFLSIMSAFFLTKIIEYSTQLTINSKIFICIYFIILLFGISNIILNKYYKRNNLYKYVITFFMFLFLCFLIINNYLNHAYSKTEISLEYKSNSLIEENKIWISDIYLDGKSLFLGDYDLPYGWDYIEEWDDIILSNENPDPLKLRFPLASKIVIRFAYYNNFTNYTTIQDGYNAQKTNIELNTTEDGEGYEYTIQSNKIKWEKKDFIIKLCFAIYCTILLTLLAGKFMNTKEDEKKSLDKKSNIIINIKQFFSYESMYYILNILLIILLNPFELDILSKAIITVIYYIVVKNLSILRKEKIELNKKIYVLLVMIISFMIAGHNLFMKDIDFNFTIKNILLFLSICIWVEPILYKIIRVLTNIQSHNNIIRNKNNKIYFKLFFVLAIIWEGFLLIYYPGSVNPDAIWQWEQCIGTAELENLNPLVHTLWLKLMIKICNNNVFFILTIQILIVSAMYSYIFYELYKLGIKKRILKLVFILFAIFPPNMLAATTLVRDTLFTAALAVLSLLFYKLAINKKLIKYENILFILTFSIVALFRHNAVIVYYGGILFVLIFALKYKWYLGWITSLFIVIIVTFCGSPLQHIVKVNSSDMKSSTYSSVLSGLGAVAASGRELDKTVYDMLTSNVEIDWWIDNYTKYNIDQYSFENENPGFDNKIIGYSGKEILTSYIKTFLKHPGSIIKARMDGADILWNCFQPKDGFNNRFTDGIWYDSRNYKNSIGIKPNNGNTYLNNNALAVFIREFIWKISDFKLLDTIVWRSGCYMILFLILLFFNKKGLRNIWIVSSIPFILYTLSWILILNHQSYRYIYYVPVSMSFLTLYACIHKSKVVE